MQLKAAQEIAEELKAILEPHCRKIAIGGSIRRQKPNVKDIEIICSPMLITPSRRTTGFIMAIQSLGHIIHGGKKGGINAAKNLRIRPKGVTINLDLFISSDNYGMALLVRTGSAKFSAKIFSKFNGLGYKSQDGIHVHQRTKEKVRFDTEEEVFDFLGIPFVHPTSREI